MVKINGVEHEAINNALHIDTIYSTVLYAWTWTWLLLFHVYQRLRQLSPCPLALLLQPALLPQHALSAKVEISSKTFNYALWGKKKTPDYRKTESLTSISVSIEAKYFDHQSNKLSSCCSSSSSASSPFFFFFFFFSFSLSFASSFYRVKNRHWSHPLNTQIPLILHWLYANMRLYATLWGWNIDQLNTTFLRLNSYSVTYRINFNNGIRGLQRGGHMKQTSNHNF